MFASRVRSLLLAAMAILPACASPAPPSTAPALTATVAPTSVPATIPEPSAPPPTPSRPATASPATGSGFDAREVALSAISVGEGFKHPLYVAHADDESGRVFIAEKIGRVRLLDGTTVLDISEKVRSPDLGPYEQEQGFLGLAFHPHFPTNAYVYAHYIDLRGRHVLSRFTARSDGQFDPTTEKVLMTLPQPETTFNGGMLVFGPDGYLYVGLGTGGNTREQHLLAQNLGSMYGKILRIDVDAGDPYGVPPDNPFVDQAEAQAEVWAYGLRNPYRFSFDRATGDLYVGGPGQLRREWVNVHPNHLPAGQNFGWPIIEGSLCWMQDPCDRTGLLLPVLEYGHTAGNCVVVGGYVYRGQRSPLLHGAYLYGDFCSGRIWAAAPSEEGTWTTTEMLRIPGMISSFGEDKDGEVYVTDIRNGVIYRLEARRRSS